MYKISALKNNSKAAGLIEYGMLVGLIAVLGIASVQQVGVSTKNTFDTTRIALASHTGETYTNANTPQSLNEGSLAFDTSATPNAVVTQPYSFDLQSRLSGSTQPSSWSLTNAPAWMTLNGTTVEGIPDTEGTFSFDITATEGQVSITRTLTGITQGLIPDLVTTFSILSAAGSGQTGYGSPWDMGSVSYTVESSDISVRGFRDRYSANESYFTISVKNNGTFPYGLNAEDYRSILTLDCGSFGIWPLSDVSHSSTSNSISTMHMDLRWTGSSRPRMTSGTSYTCTLRK